MRSVKLVAVAVVALLVASMVLSIHLIGKQDRLILKVYVAGSLSEPFSNAQEGHDMRSLFEEMYPGVEVQVTTGGSADIIRRVTELDHVCDVLASADYSLIPSMMINRSQPMAGFVIEFARNSMVIAYTEKSRYYDEFSPDSWREILRRPDVKFGFSNPNDDPCGYRSMMIIQLAELHYGDPTLFKELVLDHTNMLGVDRDTVNDTYTVDVPVNLVVTDTSKLMIRSAEIELTSALEMGSIDYLFIYESVAYRHASSGQRYISLPSEINLSDTAHAAFYQKVRVRQFADSGDESRVKTIEGRPIVYGITVTANAAHPSLAIEFIRMVISEGGQQIMRDAGQEPVVPAHAGYWRSAVPREIGDIVS